MKAKLIDGKTISAELRAQMKKEVAALAEDGITRCACGGRPRVEGVRAQ